MTQPLSRDPEDALNPDTGNATGEIVRCDACPVLCRIRTGQTGACDRYANDDGTLVRVDPLVVLQRTGRYRWPGRALSGTADDWDGDADLGANTFVTGVGADTTYPTTSPRRSSSRRRSTASTS